MTRKCRCGVCLFPLDSKAQPLRAVVDVDWMEAFATSDTHEFTSEELAASAEHGCVTCERLCSALDRFGITFTTAHWDPDLNPSGGKHPYLIIDDSDERFELFTTSDDAASKGEPSLHPAVCTGNALPEGSTGGKGTMDRAARWLDECRRDHELCTPHDAGFVPTRLLDLAGEDPNFLRLVEHPPPSTPFAALSHRWTQETLGVRLEKANLAERKAQGMPVAGLPSMMQQLVLALRHLGIQHVWIDCLCIIQDSSEDWTREAATMASIYANAELTVGSTWASQGGDGLFRERRGPAAVEITAVDGVPVQLRRAVPHFRWQEFRGGDWISHDPRVVPDQEWPLLARGWVYQEQLLSRRMLHFTRGEVLWECFQRSSCECGWQDKAATEQQQQQQHDGGGAIVSKRPAAAKRWDEVLTEYAGRPLTFETDRLPAVAGVAKSVALAKGVLGSKDAYVCGLFTGDDDLRETIFWYMAGRPTQGRLEGKIPTWSWASVASDAMGFWSYLHEDLEILGVEASFPEGADPYMGHIESASIRLSGRILKGAVHHGQDWVACRRTSSGLSTIAGQGGHNDDGNIVKGEKNVEGGEVGGSEPEADEFVLSVGGNWTTFHADYKLGEPGRGFVASGSAVSCLLIGEASLGSFDPEVDEETAFTRVPCVLVMRCVDAGEMRFERIGVYDSHGLMDGQWMEFDKFLNLSTKQTFTMV